MAKKNAFVLSFTVGGLLYHESIVLADAYAERRNWAHAIEQVESQNLMQSRTASTAVRKLREVRQRLQGLSEDQLRLLAHGSRSDQRLLLWLACCRRYQLIREFAIEVVRSKFLQLDLLITLADIDRFVEIKCVWYEEIEKLSESTRQKLQTVMMRMLRESELVTSEGVIVSPMISDELLRAIVAESPESLTVFPIADDDRYRNAHEARLK